MKKFIAVLLAVVTLMMIALVPMAANADSFDSIPFVNDVPIQPIQPGLHDNGILNVVSGGAKTAGNLVRFFVTDAVETVECLVCNGNFDKKYFSWTDAALKDYEAAKKQVSDNLDKAGDEIVNAATKVKDGACWVGGKVADGASWVWNGIKSIF